MEIGTLNHTRIINPKDEVLYEKLGVQLLKIENLFERVKVLRVAMDTFGGEDHQLRALLLGILIRSTIAE